MATTGDWLSVIYEISKVINASLELPEILGVIARETGRFVPCECLAVGLVESVGLRLRLYVAAAPGRGPELDGATVELQGSLLGHVIQIREPLVVPDLRGAGGLPGAEALAAEGMVSSVALPLVSGAKVLGAFVAARADFRPFEPPEVDMLLEVAEQTAIAVDHARLYAAEKKRSSHLAIINEVARRVLSTFDLDTLLQQTASLIQQRFAYYDVGIFLTDRRAAEVVLRAQAGAYTDESVVGYRQPIGVGMVGWCAKTGRSLLASDVRKNPHYIVAFDGERSARAELCVPIKIGGQVAGVINVESTQAGAFDQTDVTALDTLSDQVAQAIENARLYDEMRYLRELDRSILASIPSSIFVVDRNLVVVTVNEMCCRVLERGREQVVGEGLEGLLSFEELSPETLRRTVARVIDDDERHEFPNVRARLPSGAQRIVDVHLSPVARRTQRRALLFINDITERRRAEEGVLREKQKLDNIVSAIGAGLLVIDPDFTIAWSNPTCDEWFGDGASLVGTSCHDICPRRHGSASGPDVLCDDCPVLSSLSTGQVRTVPQVVMGAQRPVRHYQNIFAPIRDEGGQIVQVIRVTFDVTDQARKVEQIALLQKLSEAMQGTLELDRLLHLILTCVTAGPGLGFNRAILLLLDDSRTVLEGRLGVGPSSLEEAARIWRELSEHPQSLEHLLDRFDEPVAPGDQSMQSVSRQIRIPLEATDEAPVRAVLDKRPVVIRDTADAAHADASLRSPLGSDQFVCVPLVTRDQALGAIIADNIFTRRPIRDADVEMLRTFAAHAGLAISAASAYRKLEEQLVALEEAQARRTRGTRDPQPPRHHRRLHPLHPPHARQRRQGPPQRRHHPRRGRPPRTHPRQRDELHQAGRPHLPRPRHQRVRRRRVRLPRERPRRAAHRAPQEPRPPLPRPAVRPRPDPPGAHQPDPERARRHAGRRRAHRHDPSPGRPRGDRGGRHGDRHEQGGGREPLRAVLHHQGRGHGPRPVGQPEDRPQPRGRHPRAEPARRRQLHHPVPAHPRPRARIAPKGGRQRMATILIVEDDEHQQLLFREELSEEGYDVVVASSAQEALEIVEKVEPDAVVLDIAMPGMDGIEALGRLLAANNQLPVILHTAYATYKDNFMTWSADAYVVKSHDLSELKAELARVIAKRRNDAAARADAPAPTDPQSDT